MIASLLSKKSGRRKLPAMLGLSLEGGRLEGVVLRRANGSLQVQQSFSVPLSLPPLTAAPELVGREIRNHLDVAKIRERHCVFGLPLSWVLTAQVELPELSAEDAASFLQVESERHFPCDPGTLQIVETRTRATGGKAYAQLAGVPLTNLNLLEQVFRAAKLTPVAYALGLSALQPPALERSHGIMALHIGESQVSLQVTWNGGIIALRTLESALENEAGRAVIHAGIVAREARVTLGQLPGEAREQMRKVRVFGPANLAQQLVDELDLRLESFGLRAEAVSQYEPDEFGLQLPEATPVSAALSLAANYLADRRPAFELMPPRLGAWQRLSTRYSSGKLRLAGATAALLLLAGLAAFGYQQWQLMRWESQWAEIRDEVKELEVISGKIRQFRPWYDDGYRALVILRELTSAFPEEGSVSAKSIEVKDLATITCSGSARDSQSLLKTLDRLRASKGVSGVKVSQIRGRAPTQFTFEFEWSPGGAQ